MHPDFGAQGSRARQRLAAFLSELPWGWPPAASAEHAIAQAATGHTAAPPLAPGEVLLLTERLGEGSLWALRLRGAARGDVALDAEEIWARAAVLAPSTLPLLWQSPRLREPRAETDSLRPLASSPPRLRRAHAPIRMHEARPQATFESVVAGDSLGLALLLGQASLLVEAPLPADVAATATLGANGQLGPVGGLEAKLRALVRLTPRVRRLIVAQAQCLDAEHTLARVAQAEGVTAPTVLGLATARDAIRLVLPDELVEARWRSFGADPDRRASKIEQLLQLALADRSEAADWRPVEHAASAAAQGWPGLAGHERWSLDFVGAIAARHMGRAAERALPLPGQDELLAIPQPRRTRILAHLVQQSADTGDPDPDRVELLASAHVISGASAFPDHLKLAGALGRLLAARGRHSAAFATQRDAAEAWLTRPEVHDQVSYPLSELFRLAAILGTSALDVAEGLRKRAIGAGAMPPSSPWIEAPRARALVVLGRPRTEALAALAPLLVGQVPAHCGHVARRARRALAVRDGEPDVVQKIDADLAQALDTARRESVSMPSPIDRQRAADLQRDIETCMALTALDAAGAAQVGDAERRLMGLHPALCRVLLLGLDPGHHARVLRERFPY